MAGKNKHMRGMRLFAGGYDLSGDARIIGSLSNTFGEIEIGGWSHEFHNFLHDDQRQIGAPGFQAILNDLAGKSYPVLDGLDVAEVSVVFGSSGADPVLGDPAYMLPSIQMTSLGSIEGGVAVITADFLADAGQHDADIRNPMGVVIEPKTARTITYDGTGIDQSASTATGAWAILHVFVSSGGEWTFKIQDAPDGAAWVDLITFAIIGDQVEAEVKNVSGFVDKHVRFQGTRVSGTCTVACMFARNFVTQGDGT